MWYLKRSSANVESNRRSLGSSRRRDEGSPRSQQADSLSTPVVVTTPSAPGTGGASVASSPSLDDSPAALPALGRRHTDDQGRRPAPGSRRGAVKVGEMRKDVPVTAPHVPKEKAKVEQEEGEVDMDEVEGGTEDSEEEPDYWSKYGIIDDAALDEDAEIEI